MFKNTQKLLVASVVLILAVIFCNVAIAENHIKLAYRNWQSITDDDKNMGLPVNR